ncbi:MAG: CocE/NonD family hydrolase [Ignavibacteriales bacterium]|nr:CocE/NonD family hydrolase [Ignavibacteriales bacterium]
MEDADRHPRLHVGAVQGRPRRSAGRSTPTLYVSSDAKDTDFTVKVLDVYPDGRAYNLDESIQRMRYRDGYDKPLVWMEPGKVYKVTLQPLTTSNYFAPGHRLRIEVSSSNFPRFDRNLNTGGNNYDEAKGVVARNAVHHSKQYPVERHGDRRQALTRLAGLGLDQTWRARTSRWTPGLPCA